MPVISFPPFAFNASGKPELEAREFDCVSSVEFTHGSGFNDSCAWTYVSNRWGVPVVVVCCQCLHLCRLTYLVNRMQVADIVAFVGHVVPDEGGYIDQRGRQCLSMLRSLGLPVTTGLLVVSQFLSSRCFCDRALMLCGSQINFWAIIFPSEYCRLSVHISLYILFRIF